MRRIIRAISGTNQEEDEARPHAPLAEYSQRAGASLEYVLEGGDHDDDLDIVDDDSFEMDEDQISLYDLEDGFDLELPPRDGEVPPPYVVDTSMELYASADKKDSKSDPVPDSKPEAESKLVDVDPLPAPRQGAQRGGPFPPGLPFMNHGASRSQPSLLPTSLLDEPIESPQPQPQPMSGRRAAAYGAAKPAGSRSQPRPGAQQFAGRKRANDLAVPPQYYDLATPGHGHDHFARPGQPRRAAVPETDRSGGHAARQNQSGARAGRFGLAGLGAILGWGGGPARTLCSVCNLRPPYERNGRKYPTCGMTCAGVLQQQQQQQQQQQWQRRQQHRQQQQQQQSRSQFATVGGRIFRSNSLPTNNDQRYAHISDTLFTTVPPPMQVGLVLPCVICLVRPCLSQHLVTCGPLCAERLCTGGSDPRMCNYCHRRPKIKGYQQCGRTCGTLSRSACLLCKSRPKFKRYHLCGKTCKEIALKWTPMLLEAPIDHETFKLVATKFKQAWKGGPGETMPTIKHIFKIFEGKTFLRPYEQYRRRAGNEIFTYHGTKRRCRLGNNGNTRLCNDSGCALCQILKTSFSTRLANPNGSFGPGIYSSTASNSAYFYTKKGKGAVIVCKVLTGRVHNVNNFNAVSSCPPGFDSVVFNRNNGARNETVVYNNDAIRPVFLIVFG